MSWIKMRSGLLTNPKVIRMSRLLASDRHFMEWWTRGTNQQCSDAVYELCDVTVVTRVTVGSLLSVWGAANECANGDGRVTGITLFEVDEMAGVPGFGKAMEAVGWAVEDETGIQFPNFQEHNTVGKERSTGAKTSAERTREYRDRKKAEKLTKRDASQPSSRAVTVTSQSDHREEKRREEKEIPHTPSGVDARFAKFWSAYPSKVGKDAALKAFEKRKPDDKLLEQMLAAIAAQKASPKWVKDAGEYIPNPATWLNQGRWMDEAADINGADIFEAAR